MQAMICISEYFVVIIQAALKNPMKETEEKIMNTKGKNSFIVILIGILIVMAGGALFIPGSQNTPSPASAHPNDTYGPACGAATVDGIVDPSEWISASVKTFQMVNAGGGQPFTTTLYVMNSGYYLYMGITINDDEFSTRGIYLPQGEMIRIDFDNDHGGVLFTLDDDLLYLFAGSPQFGDWFVLGIPDPSYPGLDTEYGGTADGLGTGSRVGELNHFELRHPLCSGDGKDFCLHPADIVGFRLEYMDAEADGSTGSAQFYPAFSDTAIADIVIGGCSAVDLFTYLPYLNK